MNDIVSLYRDMHRLRHQGRVEGFIVGACLTMLVFGTNKTRKNVARTRRAEAYASTHTAEK